MASIYEGQAGQTGSQYASAFNNKPATAPRQSPDFTAPIEQAWEEVRTLQARLDALADRLCGTLPEADAGGDLRSVPSGVFDIVSERGRSIIGSVANCREALDRIERALP
jgi:plasmid stabilization system protein ParE